VETWRWLTLVGLLLLAVGAPWLWLVYFRARGERLEPTPFLAWSACVKVVQHPELDWRTLKLVDQAEARRELARRRAVRLAARARDHVRHRRRPAGTAPRRHGVRPARADPSGPVRPPRHAVRRARPSTRMRQRESPRAGPPR
jgi:hypothetical protein